MKSLVLLKLKKIKETKWNRPLNSSLFLCEFCFWELMLLLLLLPLLVALWWMLCLSVEWSYHLNWINVELENWQKDNEGKLKLSSWWPFLAAVAEIRCHRCNASFTGKIGCFLFSQLDCIWWRTVSTAMANGSSKSKRTLPKSHSWIWIGSRYGKRQGKKKMRRTEFWSFCPTHTNTETSSNYVTLYFTPSWGGRLSFVISHVASCLPTRSCHILTIPRFSFPLP